MEGGTRALEGYDVFLRAPGVGTVEVVLIGCLYDSFAF